MGGSRSLEEARRIADEVLFPAALDVDRATRVPESHLDLLAEHGFYGLAAPDDLITLDLPDYASVKRVVELLAGGCLATAFVWLQHHGAVMAVGRSANEPLKGRYLVPLVSGELRAGVAIGAAVRPGPPALRAEPVDGGWVLDGSAPWVTGWDLVHTLHVAARTADDELVWALIDTDMAGLTASEPLRLVAVQASRTVTARFERVFVPHGQVTGIVSRSTYLQDDAESLRFNGSVAHGVADRAIALLGDTGAGLAGELDAARAALAQAAPEDVPAARARGSELALRAAAALSVAHGARSVLADEHGQRLVREATFLLVFGSRPAVKAALLERLGPAGSP